MRTFSRRVPFRRLGGDRLKGTRENCRQAFLRFGLSGVVSQSLGRGTVPQLARPHHVGVERGVHCTGSGDCVEPQCIQPACGAAVRLKQRFAVRSNVVSGCETSLDPLRERKAKPFRAGC